MALPMFGCPEADTGLPKTAMPPVPLNSTTLPAPAPVPPIRLKDTPGSLGWAGPVAHAALAVGGQAHEVALDDVAGRRSGQRAQDVDAVHSVARGDVAVRRVGGADLVVGSVEDADAVAATGEGAVGHPRRAG